MPATAMDLYNGNIASMAVNIPKFERTLVYGYKYDPLNRIVSMDAYETIDNSANKFTAQHLADYKESVSYDANGNIKTYL